jgi:O-antigen/teichoic acid export membrane protein
MSIMDTPLRRNMFWSFIANGSAAFFSWLMLMILTKVAGVTEVGFYGLAQAVALPIHTFFTFKLRIVQSTDHMSEFTDDEYRNFRILSGFLNIVFAAGLAVLLYRGPILMLILIMSLSYSIVIFREFYVSVLQKHERNDFISLSTIIQGLLGLILFVIGYILTHDLRIGVAGIVISRLLSVSLVDRPLSRSYTSWGERSLLEDLARRSVRKRFLGLFRVGIPMGGVALLSALFVSIPRLVLDKTVNTEAVGFYSALSSVVVVMSLFINSLGQSLTPRLSLIYKKNKEEFGKRIKTLSGLCLLFVAGCLFLAWFYGKEILTLLFTDDYAVYSRSFFMLIVGGGLLVYFSVMNIAISAQRSFRIQFPIYLACTIVTLIASLLLIPKYGLDGAVYAYILCNLVGFVLSYLVYAENIRRVE